MNEELCESNPSSGNGAKEKDDAAIAKLALHLQRGVRGPQGEERGGRERSSREDGRIFRIATAPPGEPPLATQGRYESSPCRDGATGYEPSDRL